MVRTSTDTATVSRPSPTPSAAMPPSRSGTLSWQQRPTSRGSASVKSRPLSAVASENSAMRSPRATPDRKIEEQKEDGVSRDQISNSLASKDPAWFRQTADRGIGSAAYRKSKEEPILDTIPLHGSVRLPGFSRDCTDDPEKEISVRPEGILRSSFRETSRSTVLLPGVRNSLVQHLHHLRKRSPLLFHYLAPNALSLLLRRTTPLPNLWKVRFLEVLLCLLLKVVSRLKEWSVRHRQPKDWEASFKVQC